LALSVASVPVRVPLLVTGDPDTEKIEGKDSPTLLIPPLEPETVAQVPSPRQKVDAEALVPPFICDTAILPERSEKPG